MLSNKATPIYYGKFRDQVLRGNIPVCKEIAMQMNRIDQLIDDPRFYYDDEAIDGYTAFCENELTLTDGGPLTLLDTFKLWAEDVFGWWYFETKSVPEIDDRGRTHYVQKRVKHRLTRKQFIITSRGSAKSMYASTIQNYFLNVDTDTTKQIATAPTMRQAEEVISPISTSITKARGPYFKFLTQGSLQNTTGSAANRKKLASTKNGIVNFMTNSILEVRPMSIPKLQGLQTKCASVDEWLSCDIRDDPIGTIEQGCRKVKDYLILAISSEGTTRNGPGDDIKMELMDILKGEYSAPQVSIWWYKLDSIDEVSNPSMWMKASPNIGHTISYEAYQEEVERVEKVPSARNDILAKLFGLPMEGYTYFFSYEETLIHRHHDYWSMPCAMGADLSQGNDFCAFTFLFPLPGNRYGVKVRSYISSRTLHNLSMSMRKKYNEFMEDGSLVVLDGSILELEHVYDDLTKYIEETKYDVRAFGFDPYNAKTFVDRWTMEYGPYCVEKVIQGAKTESVPLSELKTLSEDRVLIFDQPLMSFAMGNCITMEDTNGNRKLLKRRYEEKIDNVSALLDAWVAYKLHKEEFE